MALIWFSQTSSKKENLLSPTVIHRIDTDELMRQGFAFHENGNSSVAADIFRKILSTDPTHADTLYLLRLSLSSSGDRAVAIELIKKAIEIRKDERYFHLALRTYSSYDKKFNYVALVTN